MTKHTNLLKFSQSRKMAESENSLNGPWKILIVDDEPSIHQVTTIILKTFSFQKRNLKLLHAFSATEAEELLIENPDTAVLLLDVVMETNDAGLHLAKVIRERLNNPFVRIILRTGQPGQAPEAKIIEKYDIHDYKEKTELTSQKLYTVLFSALRSYSDIIRLEQMNNELEKNVEKKIKELELAQNQLLQSEKMASIGQLAAGVAHEINNPVGYINSNVSSLKRYIDDLFRVLDGYEQVNDVVKDKEVFNTVKTIKNEVDFSYLREDIFDLISESLEGVTRVKQIVQDLKDFSHVDEAEWQWVDLHKGIDSTLNVAHNETKYKADVIKNYGNIPHVECMPSQLNQVIMNLIVNAAHAIEERGVITISTGCHNNEVWVAIADTGKGMSEKVQKRIFEPFFTTKEVGQGTGLGLSLSYGIIEKHGGRIELESEEGKGTTFTIWLPIAQPDSAHL